MDRSRQLMQHLLPRLYPLNRSLMGQANRDTLEQIGYVVPLSVYSVPTGYQAYDWTVPEEWRFIYGVLQPFSKSGYPGTEIFDTDRGRPADTPLRVMGYSEPFHGFVSKEELFKHATIGPENLPDAVPYSTCYYGNRWGVNLTFNEAQALEDDRYLVDIWTSRSPGTLDYGEIVLPGRSRQTVLFTSYICHPQMVNNELSGPVVMTALADRIRHTDHYYTYRFVYAPETLGALVYLSHMGRLEELQQDVVAAYVLTCLGGPGQFDLQYGPTQNYASDIAEQTLEDFSPLYTLSSWLERASDERQYGSPLVDLPVASIRKTPPGDRLYPQYHTSEDNLEYVTLDQLSDSLSLLESIVTHIERDVTWHAVYPGEPQLSRRDLYPTVSKVGSSASAKPYLDVLSFADGRTTSQIAEQSGLSIAQALEILDVLEGHGLVREGGRS